MGRSPQVTLKDVARQAGVSVSLVSKALHNARGPVRMSAATRRKVLRAAEEIGYQPNAAARALVTRRTGFLGFILSDNITDGWGNAVYSKVLCGVDTACRSAGYGLAVSRYNLSNVDSFILPPKAGQRSVDGLILTGYVEAAVVKRFCEFGIPCACVGDNLEVTGLVPTVACDIVDGLYQAVAEAAEAGHRHIWYFTGPSGRNRQVGELLRRRAASEPKTASCRIEPVGWNRGEGDYADARPVFEHWRARAARDRPTVLLASDQLVVAFAAMLREAGLDYPRDISLISSSDSRLCEYAFPPITSVRYDMEAYGRTAADMLIGHLENGNGLTAALSRVEPCALSMRRSLSSPPGFEKKDR